MGFDDEPHDFSNVDISESGIIEEVPKSDTGDVQIAESEQDCPEPEFTPEPTMRREDYDNLKELIMPNSVSPGDPMLTSEERRNLDTAHFG